MRTRQPLKMDRVVKAAIPASFRTSLEVWLPPWLAPLWFSSLPEGLAACVNTEVGWLDLPNKQEMPQLIEAARSMRWLNTQYVGLDTLPVDTLRQRSVAVTNGAGLNATTIAEYVVLAMLSVAKGYREVVRAQERRDWLTQAPGRIELAGTRALVIGYGAVGQGVESRLRSFGVEVEVARRTPGGRSNFLGPAEWRPRLGEFDWVILAVPATPETLQMIGRRELESMKQTAVLLNFARGSLVDQDALVEVLKARRIGAAFLDVTSPEPLPPEHALWTLANAHISMHLSGRSQTRIAERAAQRFLDNLHNYHAGRPLANVVDLNLGY